MSTGRDNVEAIVPLLPMQRAFLWHSLSSTKHASQLTLRCTLKGNVDLTQLKQAWQQVISTHQALRSTVHWKDLSSPVQIVHKQVNADVEDNNVQPDQQFDADARNFESTGNDLTKAPTHRLRLRLTSNNACQVEWSMSHVLLDGWSSAIVVNDWLSHYSAAINGRAFEVLPSMPLQHYSQWANKQDQPALVDYWLRHIPANIAYATPLHYRQDLTEQRHTETVKSIQQDIDIETSARLYQACKTAGLSLNSILQAAFALILKPIDGVNELVFSTTVSGRQVDVASIDTYVGMLINVVPVYVQIKPELSIREWLLDQQADFFATLPYAHVDTMKLLKARHDANNHHNSQFNCLLVVENQSAALSNSDLTISDYRSGIISEMDLTLVVIPEECLRLEFRFSTHRLDDSSTQRALDRLTQLLQELPSMLDQSVSSASSFHARSATSPADNLPDTSFLNVAENQQLRSDTLSPEPLVKNQLRSLWAEVFGHEVGLNQGFFDLGGTSLQAVRLFDLVQQKIKISLPATTLFSNPTINELTKLICSGDAEASNTGVVQINQNGNKTALFLPFEQSDMLIYRDLIDALGTDQPIYGLQTTRTPLEDQTEIDTLIETMKTLQPEGPFLLAGLSGSGLSAWLIAQKLKAEGHDVAMLTLLDSYGPEYPRLASPAKLLLRISIKLLREGSEFAYSYLLGRIRSLLNGKNHSSLTDIELSDAQKSDNETPAGSRDYTRIVERLATDRKVAVAFSEYTMSSRSRWERFATQCAIRLAQVQVRSFRLKLEFPLLIQGLILQYAKQQGLEPCERCTHDASISVFLERYRRMYGALLPYDGKVIYIAAQERPVVCLPDEYYGWRKLITTGLQAHKTPGTHQSMLKPPQVQTMAAFLQKEIALARRDRQASNTEQIPSDVNGSLHKHS